MMWVADGGTRPGRFILTHRAVTSPQAAIDCGTVMLPFACVPAWRTCVHARRWREGGTRGWQYDDLEDPGHELHDRV